MHLEFCNALFIQIIMEAIVDKHNQCRGYALNIKHNLYAKTLGVHWRKI